jgi:hypothetical protein
MDDRKKKAILKLNKKLLGENIENKTFTLKDMKEAFRLGYGACEHAPDGVDAAWDRFEQSLEQQENPEWSRQWLRRGGVHF